MDYVAKLAARPALVTFSGPLDATAAADLERLAQAIEAAPPPALEFDLAGVGVINSAGARVWAAFLAKIAPERSVQLKRCSVHFIDYLNLVEDLGRGAEIVTFHTLLRCSQCRAEAEVLVASSEIDPAAFHLRVPCSKCGVTMDCGIDWGEFTQFLAY